MGLSYNMWRMRYLLFVSLFVLISAGCQQQREDAGLLRVGMAQMPITLDPRFATDAASVRVQALIHRGLTRLDDHFRPQPDLAQSWTHPSPLLWRFVLRRGITFSDGSPLDAHDVVATLNALRDPALASPLKAGFAAVASIAAEADDVVVLHLKRPDASLLTRLNVGILPASKASAHQQARDSLGCGAYRLLAWSQGRLTLQLRAGMQGVARIAFVGVKDPVTRILKLKRGELDLVQNDLPPHLFGYIQQQPELRMQTRPSTTFSYIGLNLQDARLKDRRVRLALALALDRAKLKRALFADLPQLAETVLTPEHWAAAKLPQLTFDRQRAAQLLDAAGYPRGADGVRFHLIYRTSTDPTRLRLATAIAAMWQRIGIDVSIESLEWGGFYARIKRGDFQLFSLAWVGISDPDIYRWILHSQMWPPKGANRGRYRNAQVDRWLDAAARSSDQAQRQLLYAQVERQMHDDLVYIPLWYDPVVVVTHRRVHGFVAHADGRLDGLRWVTLQ